MKSRGPRPSSHCLSIHLQGLPLGTEYLYNMNPDFLLQVTRDYLTFAPQQVRCHNQSERLSGHLFVRTVWLNIRFGFCSHRGLVSLRTQF